MKAKFNKMLYGGDYNPEQWPKDVWQQDMELFDKAGINSATINVFSWARIQPAEEVYDFRELDEIVDTLAKAGKQIVLATSTAALPAWMVKRYPEVARVDYEGRRHKFGQRHNACPNSPVYRHFVKELTARLAERYGSHEHVVCWHINNEYGGECYCENCEKAFRVWLRKKYGTIEALNKAWNLTFWGHNIYDWDEVVLPNALSEGIEGEEEPGNEKTAFAGISIDYRRFNSDSIMDNFRLERDTIRQYDRDTLVTTNLMGTYKGLDYFKWAKEMDIVSWDNYPSYDTPWSMVAMRHDLMRGLKNAPFMLMEQTPSQQNWQPYNSLKKPGQMRAQSWQTVAHGGDTIQFFQLRRSVGGCEKFHGAVIGHAGSDQTRVFREVAQLGEELNRIGDSIIGSKTESKVGIMFDWDNYWALEYTSGPNKDLKYVDQITRYYEYFYSKNISVDLIPVDADFSRYDLVAAPVLYMVKEGMAKALERYVAEGGTLVTGFMSGIVNESDNVHLGGYPGPLRALAGIWAEEIDALAPEQSNEILFTDGTKACCGLLCDILHLEGAEEIARYGSNFYAGTPAVTKNAFGKGYTYYVGTVLSEDGLAKVLDLACVGAGVASVIGEETELEVTRRISDAGAVYFVMNFKDQELPLPTVFAGKKDLLSGRTMEEGEMLGKYDVRIAVLQ
ncbi:beta-galactosidase [Schaedlerella arabinosiphila]|uniref:Beta-galactosidase n=1 Tax=Schaedlerella arabinosiphila TaxID=2044587 RepID=A0A9X5C5P6_9FIRM|nr:beta-galactosidase [Schaedlerella arabinosiphila]KAI4441572.1 Beta-galactosidase LacZ [Schaedlerella arabinosiphila]MCI9603993.1 beta-galactosidase [Ruminococcus sp.]NDO68509.1 beta-galactosidase [Schaedlerella arabinosiphila]